MESATKKTISMTLLRINMKFAYPKSRVLKITKLSILQYQWEYLSNKWQFSTFSENHFSITSLLLYFFNPIQTFIILHTVQRNLYANRLRIQIIIRPRPIFAKRRSFSVYESIALLTSCHVWKSGPKSQSTFIMTWLYLNRAYNFIWSTVWPMLKDILIFKMRLWSKPH